MQKYYIPLTFPLSRVHFFESNNAFDAWIKECTKNATNAGKLKSFVEKKYEDYSSSIDNIIQLVEQFRKIDQNTLFKELLSDFVKKIRENVSKFVDKPAEYENAIDTFFTDINRELSGIIALSELSYKSREDFYSEEEKSSYTFYSTIIDGIIDHSQKLKPLNDQEKKSSLYLIASSRISSIKNALLLLKRTGVSESKDKLYQDCFLKFEKKMLDTSDDIYTHIK